MKKSSVFTVIFIVIVCSYLQSTMAVFKSSKDCFVDENNFIVSNNRNRRVFCESADFKSPKLTCLDKINGNSIQSACIAGLMCQDVSEVNSSQSKLRCV